MHASISGVLLTVKSQQSVSASMVSNGCKLLRVAHTSYLCGAGQDSDAHHQLRLPLHQQDDVTCIQQVHAARQHLAGLV